MKFADRKSGEPAAVAVVIENDFAEKVLPASLLGGPADLSFSAWRASDSTDASAGNDLVGFPFGSHEQGVEVFLTEQHEERAEFSWNSSHMTQSSLLAPLSPRISRSFGKGSSEARLLSFIAKLAGVAAHFEAILKKIQNQMKTQL